MVLKYPGLANPDISKIIGEHWREENEETKNYWKRLAEEEKARHQRQFPQYKYQPRRGGKGGAAARAASAAGEGGDPGRCPKCGGRYIATPRTPSTPFGGIPGPGQGPPPLSGANMQPFITNNPRVVETVQQQHHPHHHHPPHHRQSVDSHHGGGDPRRQPSYYPHAPEPMRPMEEDYDGMPPSISRRRGPQQDEFDMASSPDVKRRRFGHPDRSPERGSPMAAIPQHQSQQYHLPMSVQQPYSQHLQQQQQQQHPGSRRGSSVSTSGPSYPGQPGGGGGSYQMPAPLPRPREVIGGPRATASQPQQQQQQRDMGMAPPPRPSRLSTAGGVPHPPPGLPPRAGQSSFDESLTLAPLKIPNSPTHASESSGGARSLSGGGPVGLGIGSHHHQQQGFVQRGDSQARGIEAMVMSIPYMNKLDVLRKISPPLGPPALGSPGTEAKGPVIAIEGGNAALMREVRPVIERVLRSSGECEVRVWADSSVDGTLTPPRESVAGKKPLSPEHEDVEMVHTQEKTSLVAGESRHNSVSAASSGGSNTPTPRQSGNIAIGPAAGTLDYLRTIMEWHTKSAEIVKHVTTTPLSTSTDDRSASPKLTPVALIPGGFSLTLSDKFASSVAITDPYSPVDHWQWMATLWRGIVGPDLVVYVRSMTAEETARNSGTVEYRAPGVMVVKAAGDKVDEKTERRLAFEVMEWVRAGSFRDGCSFSGEGNGGSAI